MGMQNSVYENKKPSDFTLRIQHPGRFFVPPKPYSYFHFSILYCPYLNLIRCKWKEIQKEYLQKVKGFKTPGENKEGRGKRNTLR